jgi:hypothetical protein
MRGATRGVRSGIPPEPVGSGRARQRLLRKVGGLLLIALLVCASCARTGSVSGTVTVPVRTGRENPAARLRVRAIPATAAFAHDWETALADFQRELEPVRRTSQEVAAALGQARLAWDRAVATRRGGHWSPQAGGQERVLWRELIEAERRLHQAHGREEEVIRRHDLLGVAVLDRHTTQEVLTDASGEFLVAGLPTGTAYLYTRLVVEGRALVWLRPVRVRAGVQRMDLTEATLGDWPFVP